MNRIKKDTTNENNGPHLVLPCIVCGTKLESDMIDTDDNVPNEGVAFSSLGNYGSRLFDPLTGQFLEINVCDKCLRKAADKEQVGIGFKDNRLKIWKPGLEDDQPPYSGN